MLHDSHPPPPGMVYATYDFYVLIKYRYRIDIAIFWQYRIDIVSNYKKINIIAPLSPTYHVTFKIMVVIICKHNRKFVFSNRVIDSCNARSHMGFISHGYNVDLRTCGRANVYFADETCGPK